jgi:hypothetical protein
MLTRFLEIEILQKKDYYAKLQCPQFKSKFDNFLGVLEKVTLSDEAAFHISDKVNYHECQIWGTDESPEVMHYYSFLFR